MQRLPTITGTIKRRMLINFRADPNVVQKLLPSGMRPKLHREKAIIGICLIRLEQIRPKGFPAIMGISSENAAHRMAVVWNDPDGVAREGVFIPRRDTDSAINAIAGGRLFPGEHHRSRFSVEDDGDQIQFSMKSTDGKVEIEVMARNGDSIPASSCFASLQESSEFFRHGSVGYSVTRQGCRLDGIELLTEGWQVNPLEVKKVHSTYYTDPASFPNGSVEFDHALIMREVTHEWHSVSDYTIVPETLAC